MNSDSIFENYLCAQNRTVVEHVCLRAKMGFWGRGIPFFLIPGGAISRVNKVVRSHWFTRFLAAGLYFGPKIAFWGDLGSPRGNMAVLFICFQTNARAAFGYFGSIRLF